MARSRALHRFFASLTVLLVLLLGAATSAQAPSPPSVRADEDRLRVVDSLADAARPDSALTLLQPLLRESRRRRDRRALALLVRKQGELIQRQGGDPQRPAREAFSLAQATRDTSGLMGALALMGTRPLDHDGIVEPAVEWLLRLALDENDDRFESLARATVANDALARGQADEARRGFARAIELARVAGDWRAELLATRGLGRAELALGRLDEAREAHRKVARVAEDRHDEVDLGHALSDLAEIERIVGDLDAAAEDDRRAWAVFRRLGSPREWIAPALDLARVQKHVERYADAETTLAHVTMACDSLGLGAFEAEADREMADVLARQARWADAAAVARRGLAFGRALSAQDRAGLAGALAEALASDDSVAAGLDVLARELRGARGRPAPEQLDLQALRARLLLDQGRAREALDAYQRMGRGGANGWRSVQALTGAARGELGLGRPERAMDRLAEALRAWALDDEMPPELDERDRREAATGALAGLVIDLATGSGADSTDPIRVRAAYDTLQRIRARALIERTLGPQRPAELPIRFALAPLGADSLQRAVLRPGDLLLDVWPGARPPFLFALTRDSVRLARLPSDVTRRAVAFTSAIAAGPSGVDSAAWDSAAARLGASLLGPVADLVRASRRVVIATEGELVTLPWGTLILPDPRAPPAPLAADHEVLQAPSFTWWAATRRTRPELRAARVLALAGPAGENGAATAALAEVEDLGARFRHVDVVSSGHSRLAITPDRLADDDVLQLVTPTRADAFHPWYSGILLEALEVNRDPTWRASDMAGARLRARLVVLPSCAPGGRGTVAGAGIEALATALLSAGADAVVVNRWRVDEGSATRWMEAFYDRLGSGATAAEAFASAEQTMRADPATQAPVHWAGFALIGDGDVKAPLERRPRWWWPAIAAAGILIAALALVVGTRRRARVRALEN